MKRVAINGFGRIGRTFLRQAFGRADMEIVALNRTKLEPELTAYLLKQDSVYGRYEREVSSEERGIKIDGASLSLFAEREPEKLPWEELKIDLVVEATGVFRAYEGTKGASRHLDAGAKKVLLSAPPKGEGAEKIPQIVFGVNEAIYAPNTHNVISAASCTTNSLVPVAYVLEKEFGIEHAFLSTVHAYTGNQPVVDSAGSSLTRSRAAAVNIIPTTTGAASATAKVIPSLAEKMDGIALRVPVPTGSVSDFVVQLKKDVTPEEVNAAFTRWAESGLKDVLGVSKSPLVSSDVIGDDRASVVDLSSTRAVGRRFLKVLAFYDNEWGYASQLLRVAALL